MTARVSWERRIMLDRKENIRTGKIIAILTTVVMTAAFICTAGALKASAAAECPAGTATVTADETAVYKTKSADSNVVEKLKKGKTISFDREEFTSATDHSKGKCWYYSSGEKGYVKADQVDIKYGSVNGTIKSPVSFRKDAGTTFGEIGTIPAKTTVKVLCKTLVQDTAVWYKVDYNGKTGYVWETYLTFANGKDGTDSKATENKAKDPGPTGDKAGDAKKDEAAKDKAADPKKDTSAKDKTAGVKKDTASKDKAADPKKDTVQKDKTAGVKKETTSKDKAADAKKDTTQKDKTAGVKKDTAQKDKAADAKKDTTQKDKTAGVKKDAAPKEKSEDTKADIKKDTTTKSKEDTTKKKKNTGTKKEKKKDNAADKKKAAAVKSSALKKGVVSAEGTVTAGSAIVRKAASPSAGRVSVLSEGTKASLLTECFTSAVDASKPNVWYYSSDKKGFINSSAVDIRYGSITGRTSTVLNMRSGAGTGYRYLGRLSKNQPVDIVITAYASDGGKWYKIKSGNSYVYVSARYVTLLSGGKPAGSTAGKKKTAHTKKSTASDDLSYITAAGFPESYITELKKLHEKHPNWTFTPVKTGLTWSGATAKMTAKSGNNLIAASKSCAFRSTAKGNYDYLTNKYKNKDGKLFYAASKDAVKYYMDPRNWLTSKGIFMFENETYQSYQDMTAVRGILYGNKTLYKKENAQYFIDAGKKYNLSAVYLASKAWNELGTSSKMVSGKAKGYKGFYNPFNIGAYDSTSGKASERALKYARKQNWNTLPKAVNGGASCINSEYVSNKQDNLYLEHFNVRNGSGKVGTNIFMTSVSAPYENAVTIYNNYKENDLLEKEINFRIPVYKNMPSAKASKPKGNKSDNNAYLKSLIVKAGSKKYKLIATDKLSYKKTFTIRVPKKTSSLYILAAKASSKKTAGVTGEGKKKITSGRNMFKVICRSSSGNKRVYTVVVNK